MTSPQADTQLSYWRQLRFLSTHAPWNDTFFLTGRIGLKKVCYVEGGLRW